MAIDVMVWNITSDKPTTRMAVVNPEGYAPPAQVPAKSPTLNENAYPWDPFSFTGLEKRTGAVTNEVAEEFNAKHGTDIELVLSRFPFRK